MSECTPGPWVWDCFGDGITKLMTPHSGRLIVMDCVRKGMHSAQFRLAIRTGREGGIMRNIDMIDVVSHPDARLIAAAPDLLEACKSAATFLKRQSETNSPLWGNNADIQDRLQTAITKAESPATPADRPAEG